MAILQLMKTFEPSHRNLGNCTLKAILAKSKSPVYAVFLNNKNKERFYEFFPKHPLLHVHFFDFNHKQLKGFRLKASWQLAKFMKPLKIDTILSHRLKPYAIATMASKFLPPIKIISVFHGCFEFKSKRRKLLAKILNNKNITYVGVSKAVEDDLLKAGFPKNQVTYINNAMDINFIEKTMLTKHNARKKLGLSDNEFVFGQIARMTPIKGQVNLLKAFAKANLPQTKLVIIGDGKERQLIENTAKELEIQHRVVLTGAMDHAYNYLKSFDAFILSSFTEGLPMVLLESMTAKLPIISSNIPGSMCALGDINLTYFANDIEQLAKHMTDTFNLTKEERDNWGEKNYQRMQQNFSIEIFNKNFQEICELTTN